MQITTSHSIDTEAVTIGVTLDYESSGSFSPYPYYALRSHYTHAIAAMEGVPILIPYETAYISAYLDKIDGLLVPGGSLDIPPYLYGDDIIHDTTITEPLRTRFDVEIMQEAFARNMPILGICAGEQTMNVLFGGTLIQHIPDAIANPEPHFSDGPRDQIAHSVTIIPGTLLAQILGEGQGRIGVNSHHHQAAATVGPDMRVSAVAPDGVIEAIEHTKHPFCLGIEWHPEFLVTEQDRLIFRAFLQAAKDYRAQQERLLISQYTLLA